MIFEHGYRRFSPGFLVLSLLSLGGCATGEPKSKAVDCAGLVGVHTIAIGRVQVVPLPKNQSIGIGGDPAEIIGEALGPAMKKALPRQKCLPWSEDWQSVADEAGALTKARKAGAQAVLLPELSLTYLGRIFAGKNQAFDAANARVVARLVDTVSGETLMTATFDTAASKSFMSAQPAYRTIEDAAVGVARLMAKIRNDCVRRSDK